MSKNNHSVFLLEDGTVRTVGRNNYGQCGTGNTTDPQLSLYTIPDLNNVKQIACGYNHTVFLLEDGTVRTVGYNEYGQCGTGNASRSQLSLYTIPDLNNVRSLWDIYDVTIIIKYLIKQYNSYYSINPEYYDTSNKTYIPLTLEGGLVPNIQDIVTFGFRDIKGLTVQQDIDGETFIPIDKFLNNFKIVAYIIK